jgi:hypothetical protein
MAVTTGGMDDDSMRHLLSIIGRASATWKREFVVASAIQVDRTYQRGLSMSRVKRYVKEFDEFLASGIKCSRRADGSLYVIDGQHRIAAWMLARGNDVLIPVDVIEGLTVEDEARLFSRQNDRVGVNSIDSHKAKVAAGDPLHIAMQALLDKHGLDVDITSGSLQEHRRFAGVNTLREIIEQRGVEHADEVIAIAVAGLTRKKTPVTAIQMHGIHALLLRYSNVIDRERLIRVLRECDVQQLKSDALSVARIMGARGDQSWGIVFHRIYNTKLRSGRLPEWSTVSPSAPASR